MDVCTEVDVPNLPKCPVLVSMLDSDAWLKKYHVKGLGTSLRGQTRVSQRRLVCLSPGPNVVHSARARHTAVVDAGLKFLSKNLTAESHQRTNK